MQHELGTHIGWYNSYKIHERIKLDNALQIRFNNDFRSFKTLFNEIGMGIKLYENISLGLSYRYSFRDRTRANVQRLSAVLSSKNEILKSDVYVGFRLKLQRDFTWNRQDIDNVLRFKTSFSYKNKKWNYTPFASAELFYAFDYKTRQYYRYRFQIGASRELKKQKIGRQKVERDITVKYLFQAPLNAAEIPVADHVLVLIYGFGW